MSLEGTLTSNVDGLAAKGIKAAASSFIPVVGKALGDSVDMVIRFYFTFKKFDRYSWNVCNNWNMCFANSEINYTNNNISFRICNM